MSNHFDNFQMPNSFNENTFSINDHSNSSFSSNHFNSSSNVFSSNDEIINNSDNSSWVKETGIIEKMLISYGFIQCCERQARLFFHFSQYLGNTNHLKIGDPVEYEMSYDRRTGKPVAINIRKITSNDFMTKMLTTERVSGVIATEVTGNREGRVAFENLGEFFFLPFTQEDVTNHVVLQAQDKVSFIIVTDDGGNYRAKQVQLDDKCLKPQGIIHAVKDTFGFIERNDNQPNIFFHSSDCLNFKSLNIGDRVEFTVTTRKSKELATSVTKLNNSTEIVSETVYNGRIVKYNGRSSLGSGKIQCIEDKKEYMFYDKDMETNFTLYALDLVTFQLAIDCSSQLHRPCNIKFNVDTFKLNNEVREKGYVASLKDTYGFIKSPNKEGLLIYFKITELIDPNISLKLNDEVEFTFITDAQNKKCQAIRISFLPNGTIFNMFSKKPSDFPIVKMPSNSFPVIDYASDLEKMATTNGSTVLSTNNNWSNDMYVKCQNNGNNNLEESTLNDFRSSNDNFANNLVGMIVAIKNNSGFIESLDGETEYYFDFVAYQDGVPEMATLVEFTAEVSGGISKAVRIRKKSPMNVYDGILSQVHIGIVVRTVRSFNSDQRQYTGSIGLINDVNASVIDEALKLNEMYDFSLISLKYLNDYIVLGDFVKFQIGINKVTQKKRAFNIEVIRERNKGTIVFLNQNFGFIRPNTNASENKTIYFNKAEMNDFSKLKVGDTVHYYLVSNKKISKTYAIAVEIVEPNTLSNGVKPVFRNLPNRENGPKVIIIRPPLAPDGSKGFNRSLKEQ